MNKAILTGRLTKEPEARYSQGANQTCIASWTLAVDRKIKREGQPTADFIRCQAFGKSAEFVSKYFHKGMKMDVSGRIQTSSYTNKDGQTVYATDVICEDVEFGESKSASQTNAPQSAPQTAPANDGFSNSDDGFMNVPDEVDSELPFD